MTFLFKSFSATTKMIKITDIYLKIIQKKSLWTPQSIPLQWVQVMKLYSSEIKINEFIVAQNVWVGKKCAFVGTLWKR